MSEYAPDIPNPKSKIYRFKIDAVSFTKLQAADFASLATSQSSKS